MPSKRIARGCAACLMLLSFASTARVEPITREAGAIDGALDRLANGDRKRLLDAIERGEAERERQRAERETRDAEVRAILTDIADKVFAIRLNLAEIRGQRPNCRVRREQVASLTAQSTDLDRLADAANARCRAAGTDQPEVVRLCRARLDEIAAEKAAMSAQRDAIAQACGGSENGRP